MPHEFQLTPMCLDVAVGTEQGPTRVGSTVGKNPTRRERKRKEEVECWHRDARKEAGSFWSTNTRTVFPSPLPTRHHRVPRWTFVYSGLRMQTRSSTKRVTRQSVRVARGAFISPKQPSPCHSHHRCSQLIYSQLHNLRFKAPLGLARRHTRAKTSQDRW